MIMAAIIKCVEGFCVVVDWYIGQYLAFLFLVIGIARYQPPPPLWLIELETGFLFWQGLSADA